MSKPIEQSHESANEIPATAGDVSLTQSRAPRPDSRCVTVIAWSTTLMLLATAIVLFALNSGKQAPSPDTPRRALANVEVLQITPCEHRESLILPARLEADRHAVISSELPGRLARWLVQEGDHVEEGQIVAQLNSDDQEALLAQLEAQQESAKRAASVSSSQVATARLAVEKAKLDAAALKLELASAEAHLDLARRNHDRVTTLSESNITSEAEVDDVRNALTQATLGKDRAKDAITRAGVAVQTAKMRVAEAEAAADLSQTRILEVERQTAAVRVTLVKTRLRAPFAGRLEEHLIEAGEVVGSGTSLAHLYDLSHVRAIVDVADRYVPFLDTNNPAVEAYVAMAMPGAERAIRARLVIPGLPKLTGGTYSGIELDAEIARVSQSSDVASNTFKVELRLQNPGEALKQGMIARAHIDYLLYPAAIVIPLRAIVVADVGPRVLVVEQHEGREVVRIRDIQPISIRGEDVLVAEGVSAGDRVIVAGGKGVMNGEEVKVIMSDGVIQMDSLTEDSTARATAEGSPIRVPADYKVPGNKSEGDE